MSDLSDRLRAAVDTSANGGGQWYQLIHRCREAADRIDALTAERDAAVHLSILRTEDCQDAIGRHTTALRERDEARAEVEHLTAEVARLREAISAHQAEVKCCDECAAAVASDRSTADGRLWAALAEKDTDQ